MQVSLKYAEEHFADLISAVNRGEEVEIAQAEKPSIKLVPSALPSKPQGAKRILGAGRGEMRVPTDQEWQRMKDETACLINDEPLFPADAPWNFSSTRVSCTGPFTSRSFYDAPLVW